MRRSALPRGEADAITRATLQTLGERITGGEARDPATQLPKEPAHRERAFAGPRGQPDDPSSWALTAGMMGGVSVYQQPELRPVFPVRTSRLLLRPLTAADVGALLAYRSRPDVCRYVPFEPMDRQVINERLATHWATTELTDAGQALTLGVEVAETGDLVGDVVLFWHSRVHRGGEIGYVLNPDFAGHGYATEAAHALLRLGFDDLGLHRIVARVDERNDASAKLARRLGMRQEARLVHNELFKGEWSTELDFAMLADEWAAYRDRFSGEREHRDTTTPIAR